MARVHDEGADGLYEVHRHWIADVLPAGGSLLTGDAVWTLETLEELVEHFIGQPDLTKDKKFLHKLRDQLAPCGPEAVQLMAELHVIHFLHIFNGAISPTKKRSDIETILSWMPAPPAIPTEILETLAPGLIHPGQWVLSRRDTQLAWLVLFAAAWLRLPEAERQRLLKEPWAFKALAEEVDSPSSDGARMAMLHMTFPDEFEPIVSNDHKAAIVTRYADLAPADEDVDRRLLAIRGALTPELGEDFHWYDDDLDRRWSKPGKQWKPLLTWIERWRAIPEFDERERDYKLEVAAALRSVHDLVASDDPAWVESLRRCFTQTTITRWTVHDRYLRWVKKHPDAARQALLELWNSDGPAWERLRRFIDLVPNDVLANRGERLNIGSFLLMGEDPHHQPPFKISLFRKGAKLLGWPPEGDLDDADVYRRALIMFEEIHRAGVDWSVPLRDPLDAQGALWALCSYEEPPSNWPAEWWDELIAYRESKADSADVEDNEDDDVVADGDGEALAPQVDHLAIAASELLVDRHHLDEIVGLLEDKGQAVLYGPPGTGKTFLGLRLARAIAEGDEARVSLVQFHPATTYEDFIEGLRPRLTDAGQVTYEVVPGPLVRIAEEAQADPGHRYVLVVDEINRANLPKVFGELLFLLEYRSERARTIHRPDQPFGLPENLWIIGTMNTADRSIALIDAAMRRRFHFVPFFPHHGPMRGLLRRWLDRQGGRSGVADLLDAVNDELVADVGDHLLIGPSHFMRTDLSDKALEQIWTYNIFPLIEEQYWGDADAIGRWRWAQVRHRFAAQLGGSNAPDATVPAGGDVSHEIGTTEEDVELPDDGAP